MGELRENQVPSNESAEKPKKTYKITGGTYGGRTPFAGQSVMHDVRSSGQIYNGQDSYSQYENIVELDGAENLKAIRRFDDENREDDVWINASKDDYTMNTNPDGTTWFSVKVVDGSYLLNCAEDESIA